MNTELQMPARPGMMKSGWTENRIRMTRTVPHKNPAGMAVTVAMIAAPFMLMIGLLVAFSPNTPIWDDYDSVLAFLEKWQAHPSLSLMLSQHNEHRIVFDRLIFLADRAIFGHVNFVLLDAVGLVGLFVATGIAALAVHRAHDLGVRDPETGFMVGTTKSPFVQGLEILPVVLLMLSAGSWSLLGFAMAGVQQWWQLVFSLAALYLIPTCFRLRRILPPILLTVAACFTGAGGFVVWPAGALVLAIDRRWKALAAWSAAALVTVYVYFVALDYHTVPYRHSGPLNNLVHHFWLAAAWFTTFCGTWAIAWPAISCLAGIVTLAFALTRLSPFMMPRRAGGDDMTSTYTSPDGRRLGGYAVFILGTAAVGALSRAPGGIQQAVSSRYDVYGGLLLALILTASVLGSARPVMEMAFFEKRMKAIMWSSLIAAAVWFPRIPHAISNLKGRDVVAMQLYYPPAKMLKGKEILRKAMAEGLYAPPPALGQVVGRERPQ